MGWVLGFGLLVLGIARWNGPLAASAATTFWLLQAPLDRGELFTGSRRRALGWGVGAAVVGGVLLGLATLSCPVGVLAGALVVIAVIAGCAVSHCWFDHCDVRRCAETWSVAPWPVATAVWLSTCWCATVSTGPHPLVACARAAPGSRAC
ncbi:DUF6297 family protein [Luteococcus japonicus]|uniref:DUF6297 family protein n=1 Tax=Luteococcus japonicus TaxID=33984 RepID=UPI00351D0FBD